MDIKCVNALDTGTRIDWITHFLYLRKKHQAMKIVITDHGDCYDYRTQSIDKNKCITNFYTRVHILHHKNYTI